MSDLTGAGLRPFPLPMGIMIDEERPERSPCIRCATCDGFPCLVKAKADAQVVCVEPALRHPNVSLRTHAHVTRIETTPDGLGNGSGVVGRNLMLHNNSSLIAISREPNPTLFQKTLGINDYYFGDDEWQYPLGAMQMLGRSDPVTIAFDAPDAEDPAELARHSLDFWLTTEDLPQAENRVRLGRDGRLALSYTPTNLEAHERLIGRFRGLLDTMGCRQEVHERPSYLGGRLGISGVAHQNGTIRFGDDPATSALDLDCRMHEVDNLYVADSSFFVSSTAVNPTLTIVANALRVADHIADRLGVRGRVEVAVAA